MTIIASILLIVALYFGFRVLARFWAVYTAMQPFLKVFKTARAARHYQNTKQAHNATNKQNNNSSDDIIQCASCDLYVPQKEAIYKNGKYFCSYEHINN